MDYIAGSFYDGFVLYAMALEETLAEGGAQNDGISITMKMQNRRMWGERISKLFRLHSSDAACGYTRLWHHAKRIFLKVCLTAMAACDQFSAVSMQRSQVTLKWEQGLPPVLYNYSVSEQLSPHAAVNCLFGVGCSHALLFTPWRCCHTSWCRTMGYCF